MRKHRCHGGVKVARFPGMSEVSGSIPVSGLCFLLIFVVFTLCQPCLLSACTVKSVVLRSRHRACCRLCLDVRTAPARCYRLCRTRIA